MIGNETRVGIFIIGAITVFFYLSLSIGEFRIDRHQYHEYKTYFDDTGGLDVKASVKIAGVPVGWVDKIYLLEGGKAEVAMRVNRNNRLSRNAYAMITQEGLIGNKSIEIDPGDPSLGYLSPGSTLSMHGRSPTSINDLLDQFKDIAGHIKEVVSSFENTFATAHGEEQMNRALTGIADASSRMADFSEVLERTMRHNESHFNDICGHLKTTTEHLAEKLPSLTSHIEETAVSIKDTSDNFSEKFSNVSYKASSAFESFEDTSLQARDSFTKASSVIEKVDNGKGILGKLINEDELYNDVRKTVRGLKEYVTAPSRFHMLLDLHSETLFKTSNSKGIFEIRIRSTPDYFYLFQMVSSKYGTYSRSTNYVTRKDAAGQIIPLDELSSVGKRDYADITEVIFQNRNALFFSAQACKRFDRLIFRIGAFESTFGAACDFYVPLPTNKVHWVTSLEMFDFTGYNTLDSHRPHVRWTNKAYFGNNFYTVFGMDDMISKLQCSPFFGGGLRFDDDDFKFLLSYFPLRT